MKRGAYSALAALVLVAAVATSGCATYKTVSNMKPGSPKVYSGTRLDVHVLRDQKTSLLKYGTTAPGHPLADLPFSFVLDTLDIAVDVFSGGV